MNASANYEYECNIYECLKYYAAYWTDGMYFAFLLIYESYFMKALEWLHFEL